MCSLLPDLGVENWAEIVAKLAVEVVEPFSRLEFCGNLDTCVLFQAGTWDRSDSGKLMSALF